MSKGLFGIDPSLLKTLPPHMQLSLLNSLRAVPAPSQADRLKLAVWNSSRQIPQLDPAMWRYDSHNKPAKWSEHGNRHSIYGWELDHFPFSKENGGPTEAWNLRVLNCRDNAANLHNRLLGDLLNRR